MACGRRRVYPRTRGGTELVKTTNNNASGLSPHPRGNLSDESVHDRPSGSI